MWLSDYASNRINDYSIIKVLLSRKDAEAATQ